MKASTPVCRSPFSWALIQFMFAMSKLASTSIFAFSSQPPVDACRRKRCKELASCVIAVVHGHARMQTESSVPSTNFGFEHFRTGNGRLEFSFTFVTAQWSWSFACSILLPLYLRPKHLSKREACFMYGVAHTVLHMLGTQMRQIEKLNRTTMAEVTMAMCCDFWREHRASFGISGPRPRNDGCASSLKYLYAS
eukprot:5297725-Pleurochrysis_carterae.AAC.2